VIDALFKDRLEADTAVTDFTGTRIYPGVAPKTSERPLLVWRLETVEQLRTMKSVLKNGRAQFAVQVQADDYQTARRLAEAVKRAIDGWADPDSSPRIVNAFCAGPQMLVELEANPPIHYGTVLCTVRFILTE